MINLQNSKNEFFFNQQPHPHPLCNEFLFAGDVWLCRRSHMDSYCQYSWVSLQGNSRETLWKSWVEKQQVQEFTAFPGIGNPTILAVPVKQQCMRCSVLHWNWQWLNPIDDLQYTFPSHCWLQQIFSYLVGIGLACLKLGQTSLPRVVTQQSAFLECWGDFPSYCWDARLAFLMVKPFACTSGPTNNREVTPTC